MNTPVSYNVAPPSAMNAASQVPEKKESGGVFGWLGSLFGSSTPSANAAAPAAVGGRRRRSRKSRAGKAKRSRKSQRK
jgi:hypothetical protein